jgi:hypothetical protein
VDEKTSALDLPIDPRVLNLDQELLEAAGKRALSNSNLMFLHLRDARQLLRLSRHPVMAKATIGCTGSELGTLEFDRPRFCRTQA